MGTINELQTFVTNKHKQADNGIGDEGAVALSEALKTDSTLQSLDLHSEQEASKMDKYQTLPANNANKQATTLEQKEQER